MAKKVSFNDLPAAVGKILEILSSEESEYMALPELVQRVTVMEKRLDKIEQILSPNRPTMDKQTVMRVLKVRPKILSELENSGLLLSHSEGRRTFFYEDDVVRCFMSQSSWKNILEEAVKPVPVESAIPETQKSEQADSASNEVVITDEGQLVDMDGAIRILDRTKLTIYKLTSQNKIPFTRKGNKLYFEVDKLEQWKANNSSRKRKSKDDGNKKSDWTEEKELVDIYGASEILDRTPGAIHQHLSGLPHRKMGNKLYFDPRELEEWGKTHPSRKRKSKSNETQ